VECEIELEPSGGPAGPREGNRGSREASGPQARGPEQGHVRIGLGYVRGVRERELDELVAARRAGGRFRGLADLASRAGSSGSSLELLAWAGACDSLARQQVHAGSVRRAVLWQLGIATPGRSVPGGIQLALALDLPSPPELRTLSPWESMLADYGSTGLTVGSHPLALLRESLPPGAVSSRDLETLRHGARVRVGGLVVARQRPGTANGVVFVLLEDEHGTINLIVPAQVYERHRLTVRTEPLMLVEGRLERFAAAGGAINVLVDRVGSITAPDRILAEVKDFSMLDERELATGRAGEAAHGGEAAGAGQATRAGGATRAGEAEDFRAVAPEVMSFGAGRRR